MTRTPKLAAAFLSFCVIAPAVNAAPFPPPENVAGGYAWNWRSKSLSASDQPRPLPRIPEEELTTDQRAIVDLAKKIPGNQHNLAIILVERGRILYENYKWPSNSRAPMMSWSMSKSLTAYTIGNMYCDGVIGNLAAPAMTYSKTLENLGVYGQAPVVDLMKMASGAAIPTGDTFSYDGGRYPGVWMDIAFSQSLSLEQYMKDHSAPYIAPGSQYSYSNTDTIALGYVAEDNGGFISNFDKYIWKKIGAERKGYWLIDRNGKALTSAGFLASARDWARLAMFSIDQLKRGDQCIRDFMGKATSPQIRTTSGNFTHYGYQTFVDSFQNQKSYWWRGVHGQVVAVDPERERILYVGSYGNTYSFEVSHLFREWQKRK